MRTARHVDDVAARLQASQVVTVQDVLRVRRERQQVDEHPAGSQKIVEAIFAAERAHTLDGLGCAAPALHRKVELRQGPGHAFAQHAQAHHPHGEILAQARLAKGPMARAHAGLIGIEFTEMADDGVAHVFGHLHGHAGIIEAHHANAGRKAPLQQCIDPRANVEQGLNALLLVQELLGRSPDHGVVGDRGAGLPDGDIGLRQGRLQALEPGFGLGVGTAKGDFHGYRAYLHHRQRAVMQGKA